MDRLARGEHRLQLPPQDKNRLLEEVKSIISGKPRAVLKLVLTRGLGGRGYRPPADAQTTRILSLHEWPEYPSNWYSEGIALRVCNTRIGRSRSLAGLKHLNRLEQVLARQEWNDPAIPEGLMLDDENRVIEGTQSNLFLVRGRTLLTPNLSNSGVVGIVRELVLEVAEELGIETVITDISLADVTGADALYITNSLLGICPVASLAEHRFNIQKIPAKLVNRVHEVCFGFS